MKCLHLTTITTLCLFLIGCDLQFAASEEKTIPVSGKITGELGEKGEALVLLKGAPKRSVVVYCRVGDDSDYNTFEEVSCSLTEVTEGTVAAILPDATRAGWDYEVEYFYGLPPK